jgi:hypothetical protein
MADDDYLARWGRIFNMLPSSERALADPAFAMPHSQRRMVAAAMQPWLDAANGIEVRIAGRASRADEDDRGGLGHRAGGFRRRAVGSR